MLIILDNAESVLDPQGTDAQEIYTTVEESVIWFNNPGPCIIITSHISTTPPDCTHLGIPTLLVNAACNTFYRIYDNGSWTNLIDTILGQLDFYTLSITLLHQKSWQHAYFTYCSYFILFMMGLCHSDPPKICNFRPRLYNDK